MRKDHNKNGSVNPDRYEHNARTQAINHYEHERHPYAKGEQVIYREHHMMGGGTGTPQAPSAPAHGPAIKPSFESNHLHGGIKEELIASAQRTASRRGHSNRPVPASTLVSMGRKSKQQLQNEIMSPVAQTAFANGQFYTTSPIKMRALTIDSSVNKKHRYYKKKPRTLEIGGELNDQGTAYWAKHFQKVGGMGNSFTFPGNRITFDEDGNPI